MGTPSGGYYGGDRKGDNLFAETLLCLDARTGERVWHFQTVRHGLWDYDLPGAPVLYTAEVDGRSGEAVAVSAKTGFVFACDRVTGEPVWPIEDRPVPASDVPGERAALTQPFPTQPPPFSRQGFMEADLVSLTPELNRTARRLVRGMRFGPLYTPPSIEGTLGLPGIIGGGNWGGSAVDPETGWLYVKSTESPAVFVLGPADTTRVVAEWNIDREKRGRTRMDGIPIIDPPYGTLTAIDMNRGEITWQVPVGDDERVRSNPALAGVALPGSTRRVRSARAHRHPWRPRLPHGRGRRALGLRRLHRTGAVERRAARARLRQPDVVRDLGRSSVRGDRRGRRG